MRILFDQNISFRSVNFLHAIYSEAKHVKEFDLQHATDRQIWNFAKTNQYSIVTFDSDFYDLVTLYGHPPKIIWLRIGNTTTQNLVKVLESHFDVIKSFLSDSNYADIACLEISE